MWFDRVLLSPRVSDVEELEEFVCWSTAGDGWVRAREERRGVMASNDVSSDHLSKNRCSTISAPGSEEDEVVEAGRRRAAHGDAKAVKFRGVEE